MPWEVPPLVTLVKLVLHPIIIFVLLSLLGPFDQIWVYTAVLMAALPPALNVFVFARQYDTWVEQASSAVLIGTLVSVVTLTSVMWMVKTHTLPALLFGEAAYSYDAGHARHPRCLIRAVRMKDVDPHRGRARGPGRGSTTLRRASAWAAPRAGRRLRA